ncbi:hypothetical protein ABWH96_02170 [Marivirga tractuosa]|uniref:hypothetical protein n=1 Tax=Marivirga tractuosa TaxID=1006 RepID=UPI0035D12CD3
MTDEIYIQHLFKQSSIEKIDEILSLRAEWSWLNFLIVPLIHIIKVLLISFWILCGMIIFGFKSNFNSIIRVVLVAEFVWLLPSIILVFWFGLIDTSYTFSDVQTFAPLSLLILFDASQLESWLIYPLKSLNLFEVIYLLVLALGIKKIIKKDYDSALKFTLPVYGSALVVWILFVTFLSINLGA